MATSNKTYGSYNPFKEYNGLMFISGQIGIMPGDKQAPSNFSEQFKIALNNLERLLKESNSQRSFVLKVSVYLVDMNDFKAMDIAFANFFSSDPPSRSTVAVKDLPIIGHNKLLVEIDAIAYRKGVGNEE